MKRTVACAALTALAMLLSSACFAETITIATVNNGDMIRMQKMTDDFKAKNPGIEVNWVTLEENVLRQRVTTDIATKGGQYDVLTIGNYEVPIWGKKGWLVPLNDLGPQYDVDDLLPAVRQTLTVDNTLYAVPFYGESFLTMYRTDLFKKAGLEMPKEPTWDFIAEAAKKINDKKEGTYGICLRGKAGWVENMCLISLMGNAFGARWFDEKWHPQFDTEAWKKTATYYVNIMKEAGPPGASANGFNENLALFQTGKCGIWVDASVAASFVSNPAESKVADKVAFAMAPNQGLGKRSVSIWSWNLAIPAGSKKTEAAKKFIAWATSKDYMKLVASRDGWANVPPGTRTSLYTNPEYQKVASFAAITLDSINSADPKHPTVDPVPYTGLQFVAIPEFQAIGTAVGQQFSAALTGQVTAEQALKSSQQLTDREMRKGGYYK